MDGHRNRDRQYGRAGRAIPVAAEAGVHGAFGFPIRLGNDVVGVVEFFTRDIAAPDADLLATMSTVGNQIGQFIGRKRVDSAIAQEQRERKQAEDAVHSSEERFRTLAASNSALTLYEQDRDLR